MAMMTMLSSQHIDVKEKAPNDGKMSKIQACHCAVL